MAAAASWHRNASGMAWRNQWRSAWQLNKAPSAINGGSSWRKHHQSLAHIGIDNVNDK